MFFFLIIWLDMEGAGGRGEWEGGKDRVCG